jgi:hypothetical protein
MIFGEHPLKQWETCGAEISIYNFPENQGRGNISRIVLYWLPNDSIDRNKDELPIWEVRPEKPTPFAGFKFQVFVTSPAFKLTRSWAKDLPNAGGYFLEIFGYPSSVKLVEYLPSTLDVMSWPRTPCDGEK